MPLFCASRNVLALGVCVELWWLCDWWGLLKSSNGMSPGGCRPDLYRSVTILESCKEEERQKLIGYTVFS